MINEVHKHRMAIFTCEATRYFSEKVVAAMNRLKGPEDPEVVLGPLEVTHFSDGEFVPFFAESVRGATCFILQSTFPPTDNLMELLLSMDAAKRASANKVIAVIPYFGWARQDRKDKPRVSIGAKLVANMIKAAGADALMTCDLHADQIQGFFDLPVNHLYASYDFLGILRKMQKADPERFTIGRRPIRSASPSPRPTWAARSGPTPTPRTSTARWSSATRPAQGPTWWSASCPSVKSRAATS